MKIFESSGGQLILPDQLVLIDRQDGGNLIVAPPREVWDRGELDAVELTAWGFLVAAAGQAMLEVLPQLDGGCINYWDAGNWSLNEAAEPKGRKGPKNSRKVHLHLIGRSPEARSDAWQWGEAPFFPTFVDRFRWSAKNERLSAAECQNIVSRVERILIDRYGFRTDQIYPWAACEVCGYPMPETEKSGHQSCYVEVKPERYE